MANVISHPRCRITDKQCFKGKAIFFRRSEQIIPYVAMNSNTYVSVRSAMRCNRRRIICTFLTRGIIKALRARKDQIFNRYSNACRDPTSDRRSYNKGAFTQRVNGSRTRTILISTRRVVGVPSCVFNYIRVNVRIRQFRLQGQERYLKRSYLLSFLNSVRIILSKFRLYIFPLYLLSRDSLLNYLFGNSFRIFRVS